MKKQLLLISIFFVGSACGMGLSVVPTPASAVRQPAMPTPAEPDPAVFDSAKRFQRFFTQNPDALARYQRHIEEERRQCADEAQRQRRNPSPELDAAIAKNAELRAEINNLFFVFPKTKKAWRDTSTVDYQVGQDEFQRVTRENTNLEERLAAHAAKRMGVCAGIGGVAGAIIALYTHHASPKAIAGCAAVGAVTVGIALPTALAALEYPRP